MNLSGIFLFGWQGVHLFLRWWNNEIDRSADNLSVLWSINNTHTRNTVLYYVPTNLPLCYFVTAHKLLLLLFNDKGNKRNPVKVFCVATKQLERTCFVAITIQQVWLVILCVLRVLISQRNVLLCISRNVVAIG